MLIDGTVDTSKTSEVKPIQPVSPRYQSELNIEGVRLEIPYEYAMKIGILFEDEINVYWEEDNLYLSCLTLPKGDPIKTPTYYYKIGGCPTSELLDDLTCSKFIVINHPSYKIGDKIRYEYQSEKDTGTERHLKCSLS